VRAAEELAVQVPDVEVVVVADGSGGTHAGLVAGFGDHARVLGVDVGTRPGLAEAVTATAVEAAAMAGLPAPVGSCQLDGERIGDGYGAPSAEARRALDLAARLEGLVLDPVYTGKAMAGLIAAVGDGRIGTTGSIVFVHTGGMPALFATSYATWVREGTGDDEEWRRGGAGAFR
jgi:D-cysteine desulfhydrase